MGSYRISEFLIKEGFLSDVYKIKLGAAIKTCNCLFPHDRWSLDTSKIETEFRVSFPEGRREPLIISVSYLNDIATEHVIED